MAERALYQEKRTAVKRCFRWLLILALMVAVGTACESGSVSGSRERCSHSVGSGRCTGSFRKLSGTYTLNVENDRIFDGTEIQVDALVSVESGPLKVWIRSPGDETTSVEVLPGPSATLTGIAVGDADEFDVKFQALDGQAEGVSYEITYQLR
jgi:hypothetical protein